MRDAENQPAAVNGNAHAFRSLKRFGNTMSSWQDRELSSVISSVGRHQTWLNCPMIEEHLSESTFDPRTIMTHPTTVYLILPPKYLTTLSRLMRLWLTTLYNGITEGGPQKKRTVLFLLDEVGNIGPMPALYQAITLGRGLGIRVWLFLQSVAQLKTIFPKEGEHQAIEASIDHRMFFGIRDYASAEAISNYMGQETIQITSKTSGTSSTSTKMLIASRRKLNDHMSKLKPAIAFSRPNFASWALTRTASRNDCAGLGWTFHSGQLLTFVIT